MKKEETKKFKCKKTVLVVEDELPLQKAIRCKLEKFGLEVVTARNVKQAMNHLRDVEDIGLIWLDHYLLGEESGLDMVNKIKNDKKLKKIPIYLVSNTASPKKIKTYLGLGVNKYYTKSDYRLEEIIKHICKEVKKDK